jgi:hypothetical protein
MLNILKKLAAPAVKGARKEITTKFVSYIEESVKSDSKISSTRIQTYIMLISVILSTAAFLAIEIANAVVAWFNNKPYVVSSESIIIFGMILSHHLGMMFSKPKSYNPDDFNTQVDKIEERVNTKLRKSPTASTKSKKTTTKATTKAKPKKVKTISDIESDESANYI